MAKNLFNFYVDDNIKKSVIDKLSRLTGEKTKGQMASLIRVLLKNFDETPDNEVDKKLIKEIEAEYEYSQKLNKRSRL